MKKRDKILSLSKSEMREVNGGSFKEGIIDDIVDLLVDALGRYIKRKLPRTGEPIL